MALLNKRHLECIWIMTRHLQKKRN
jgi:hypothetical protein